MKKHTVVSIDEPTTTKDALTEMLREGAQRLLAEAVQAELEELLEKYGVPRNAGAGYRVTAGCERSLKTSDSSTVSQDYEEAARRWRIAAEQGIASAQYNLGCQYDEGNGVPLDLTQAYIWFDRAATGYQELIDSGYDMRQAYKDAIKGRRRIWITRLLMGLARLVMHFGKSRRLLWAARYGKTDVAKRLINKGVDFNAHTSYFSLLHAAGHGHRKLAELLIAEGADVNAKIKNGASPLYGACQHECMPAVTLLLENGAEVNTTCKDGSSPLLAAAGEGHTSIIEALISKGGDVHLATREDLTPLHVAAQNGHVGTVELLLNEGADFNLRFDGQTPLYLAARSGHTPVVRLLIGKG